MLFTCHNFEPKKGLKKQLKPKLPEKPIGGKRFGQNFLARTTLHGRAEAVLGAPPWGTGGGSNRHTSVQVPGCFLVKVFFRVQLLVLLLDDAFELRVLFSQAV